MISAKVSCSRKLSILPCRRFKNGQIEQADAFSEGQVLPLVAQSKTAGDFPSAAHIMAWTVILSLSCAKANPPWAPLNELRMPLRAIVCSILAKKLFEISSSRESVSASIGLSAFARTIIDKREY